MVPWIWEVFCNCAHVTPRLMAHTNKVAIVLIEPPGSFGTKRYHRVAAKATVPVRCPTVDTKLWELGRHCYCSVICGRLRFGVLLGRFRATEVILGWFLSVKRVIDYRNSFFLHQPGHQRDGLCMIDCRGHPDRHSLGPIQGRHSG